MHVVIVLEERNLWFHMTQVITDTMPQATMQRSNLFSMEIIICGSTTAKELISVNKNCHYVT